MSGLPEIVEAARGWLEKAENDRRNAEYVLTMDLRCPTDTVCFHCQQCAEKYLKALLVLWQKAFPKTHDLVLLAGLAESPQLDALRNDLALLNRYSVEARYPGVWEAITKDEARQATRAARRVRAAIVDLLPPEALPADFEDAP